MSETFLSAAQRYLRALITKPIAVGAVMIAIAAGTANAQARTSAPAPSPTPATVERTYQEFAPAQPLSDYLMNAPSMVEDGVLKPSVTALGLVQHHYGKDGLDRISKWRSFVAEMKAARESGTMSDAKILSKVQKFVSKQIRHRRDVDPRRDYWQSALETFARGGGDCEDQAFAKHATLRLIGFDAEQLAIAVGWNRRGGGQEAHAILIVAPEGQRFERNAENKIPFDPIALDNLTGKPLPVSKDKFEVVVWLNELSIDEQRSCTHMKGSATNALARSRSVLPPLAANVP